MSYKVTINTKTFELPKCTLTVEEKVENIRNVNIGVAKGTAKKRELVELMIDYVESLIGVENAQEALNYTDVEDIDTKELEMAVNAINAAFSKPKEEAQLREATKVMADIKKLLDNKAVSTMSSLMSAQQ